MTPESYTQAEKLWNRIYPERTPWKSLTVATQDEWVRFYLAAVEVHLEASVERGPAFSDFLAEKHCAEIAETAALFTDPDGRGLPLRTGIENGELVIRIGCSRLDGNDDHPKIGNLPIDDPIQWGDDVAEEMDRDRGDGATPLSLFIDDMILAALANGSCAIDYGLLRQVRQHVIDPDDDLNEPLGQACVLGDTDCESCS